VGRVKRWASVSKGAWVLEAVRNAKLGHFNGGRSGVAALAAMSDGEVDLATRTRRKSLSYCMLGQVPVIGYAHDKGKAAARLFPFILA
jgi:hypothetical protein